MTMSLASVAEESSRFVINTTERSVLHVWMRDRRGRQRSGALAHPLRPELQADQLSTARVVGRDVASLLQHYQAALDEYAISDVADLFSTAAELLETDPPDLAGASFVLLDVPVWSAVERTLIRTIAGRARTVTATVPFDDRESEDAYRALGFVIDVVEPAGGTTLGGVRAQASRICPHCLRHT